ncbi:MAG: FAD-binding oxidoreductase [Mesorhizobium sp.]
MARSWRDSYVGVPAFVVQPSTTEELQTAVRLCAEAGIAVVPQGGNTGLTGAAQPDGSGQQVIISTRRLNRIRSIDLDDDTMVVEAGCILGDVKDAAEASQRLFPLTLGAQGSCTIGGNIATNAGGINALRYGTMREMVCGLEVVLADGRIWNGLNSLRKDNAGYALKHLFIGSEGTLGIVTAATLKLFPLPRAVSTIFVGMESPAAALGWFRRLRHRFAEQVTAVELIERVCVDISMKHIPDIVDPLPQPHPWYVLADLASFDNREDIKDGIGEVFAEALEAGQVADGVLATSSQQSAALWRLREAIPDAHRREGISYKHDISVPVAKVPEFIEQASQALAERFPGIRSFAFGHLGDGNIHFNPLQANGAPEADWSGKLAAVNRTTHDIAIRLGGSITAEHGIGQLRREELAHYKPPIDLELMRGLKSTLDPQFILNPGKIFV